MTNFPNDPEDVNGVRFKVHREVENAWTAELWAAHSAHNKAQKALSEVQVKKTLWTRLSNDCKALLATLPPTEANWRLRDRLLDTQKLADTMLERVDSALSDRYEAYDRAYYNLQAVKERKP